MQVSELTVFERPLRLASKGVEGPVLPITGSYELTPDGDGTRVRFEVAYEVHSLRRRLLMPVVRRVSARGLASAYRRLSAVLEDDPHGAHAHDCGHEH